MLLTLFVLRISYSFQFNSNYRFDWFDVSEREERKYKPSKSCKYAILSKKFGVWQQQQQQQQLKFTRHEIKLLLNHNKSFKQFNL